MDKRIDLFSFRLPRIDFNDVQSLPRLAMRSLASELLIDDLDPHGEPII